MGLPEACVLRGGGLRPRFWGFRPEVDSGGGGGGGLVLLRGRRTEFVQLFTGRTQSSSNRRVESGQWQLVVSRGPNSVRRDLPSYPEPTSAQGRRMRSNGRRGGISLL